MLSTAWGYGTSNPPLTWLAGQASFFLDGYSIHNRLAERGALSISIAFAFDQNRLEPDVFVILPESFAYIIAHSIPIDAAIGQAWKRRG